MADEKARGGSALPWSDPTAFARRAVGMAFDDLERARSLKGPVFFDRGLIDAAVALEHASGTPVSEILGGTSPYSDPVFLAPPWAEVFTGDEDRRHGFDAATAECDRIATALAALRHRVLTLPKAPVGNRARFVLDALG